MQLLTGIEQQGDSKDSGAMNEVLLQTTLAGGTAKSYVRDKDNASWSFVADLTDVPQTMRVPRLGFYKVELTGAATCYGDWS